jgi:hypothetical protein
MGLGVDLVDLEVEIPFDDLSGVRTNNGAN